MTNKPEMFTVSSFTHTHTYTHAYTQTHNKFENKNKLLTLSKIVIK